jgi:segregation and condensation protein B
MPMNEPMPEAAADQTPESSPALAELSVEPEQVLEALLFASDAPLTPQTLAQLMGAGDARDVRRYVENLNRRYQQANLSFRIEEIAKGFQMLSLPTFQPWLAKLASRCAETRLSPAALETLSVVAYKQPVLRAEVEAIRGVMCGEVLNRLREMGLIKIVGRAPEIGRPILYGTTKRFLEVFGLGSLEDLPKFESQLPPPTTELARPFARIESDGSSGDAQPPHPSTAEHAETGPYGRPADAEMTEGPAETDAAEPASRGETIE